MPKPAQTQWDFGDLFSEKDASTEPPVAAPAEKEVNPLEPAEASKRANAQRKILSVSEITSQIRRLLEGSLGMVWVTGEITNLKLQSSGHIYFTLKDSGAQLG